MRFAPPHALQSIRPCICHLLEVGLASQMLGPARVKCRAGNECSATTACSHAARSPPRFPRMRKTSNGAPGKDEGTSLRYGAARAGSRPRTFAESLQGREAGVAQMTKLSVYESRALTAASVLRTRGPRGVRWGGAFSSFDEVFTTASFFNACGASLRNVCCGSTSAPNRKSIISDPHQGVFRATRSTQWHGSPDGPSRRHA